MFGASHEAALTHINQIKAFPLERFFANLSNKYVGLFFFEKKKLIIFGETYTNARRIIPLLGSRGEEASDGFCHSQVIHASSSMANNRNLKIRGRRRQRKRL